MESGGHGGEAIDFIIQFKSFLNGLNNIWANSSKE
jgi:hypothetical protein